MTHIFKIYVVWHFEREREYRTADTIYHSKLVIFPLMPLCYIASKIITELAFYIYFVIVKYKEETRVRVVYQLETFLNAQSTVRITVDPIFPETVRL